MKRLYLLVCLAVAGAAFAASSYTEGAWQLVTATGSLDASSYSDCLAKWRAQPEPTRQRTDYCRQRLVTKRLADVPPPPPAPVDCVVSEWSAPVVGEWSECANSVQTRTSSRTRTVVTPAANGGKACPTLTDSIVESRSCTVDPPPVDPPAGDVVFASPPNADMSALKAGQTMVLKPGTYASLKTKACASTGWCGLRAETDGTVTLPALSLASNTAWYLRLEGLKFKGTGGSVIMGSNVKVFRTAFQGGPANNNAVSLQIGTNDFTPGASNILIEDSWVYGLGGRYKALVYNSKNVVLRRVLVRHDGGWTFDGSNPQGGFALYDSVNVACQDCIFADSVPGLTSFEAALYLVSNSTTSQRQANVSVTGAIILNSPNNGLAAEGTGSAATYNVSDVAVVGSVQGGFNTNNQSHVLNITRALADVKGAPFASWKGTVKASACVYKGGANTSASLSNCSGTLPASITQPNASGQGASITKRIGVSGTLFGEPGYDQLLGESLWPYPNEDRIKADLDAVRVTFGAKTVTEYLRDAKP